MSRARIDYKQRKQLFYAKFLTQLIKLKDPMKQHIPLSFYTFYSKEKTSSLIFFAPLNNKLWLAIQKKNNALLLLSAFILLVKIFWYTHPSI